MDLVTIVKVMGIIYQVWQTLNTQVPCTVLGAEALKRIRYSFCP